MSDIKMTNIPSMNVGKMVEKLSNAYCTMIQNNHPIRTIHGSPAIEQNTTFLGVGD